MSGEKKKAIRSGGTDNGQPQVKHESILAQLNAPQKSFSQKSEKNLPQAELTTVSMTELYETAYPPRTPIVDGILSAGTYLFVGAPKVGKSFFMAQLSYHVSMGLDLWDYRVHRGTVLYLALEDDYARLQKRLSRMFGVEGNDNLHFAVTSMRLGDGLDAQLETFTKRYPDTRLIIIDTLQKVREAGGDRYSYASDYEIVTRLKQFSDKQNIAILLVHHTRKLESEDSFDMISGTNGLLGAADGAFIMQKKKRTDNTATIAVAGRDQQDQELTVEFDRDRCIWEFTKAETELWKAPPDPLLEAVAGLVSDSVRIWKGSASELLTLLPENGLQPNTITRKLNVNTDRLFTEYGVIYTNTHTREGSLLQLKKMDVA